MSTTPAGLQRFSRSMVTRYKGQCAFCGTACQPGTDFAALSSGKWLTVCVACSVSITAQVRAMVVRLQAASAGLDAAAMATIQALLPAPAGLSAAVSGEADEALSYDVLVRLDAAFDALTTIAAPAPSELLAGLQAVAANAQAAPRDLEFAGSLAAGLVKHGTLTERQAPHADRLIAKYADGATPGAGTPAASVGEGLYLHADGTVRKVYMTRNDRLACKRLIVHGDHATFEYETGGRRIVADAVAADTAHQMTQDEAAAFGRQYSFCCNCAKYLDDDRSLAAGYGPTCAANNGWHYPSHAEAAEILGRPLAAADETQAMFEAIGLIVVDPDEADEA